MTSDTHRATSRSYLFVFGGLMVLAAVSYAISFAPLGDMRVPAALAISVAKVALVAVFFMELIDQRATNRFVPVAALLLIVTLIGLMIADVLTRGAPPLLPPTASAPAPGG
jgi:caa(3)-type oxidase subunit IV